MTTRRRVACRLRPVSFASAACLVLIGAGQAWAGDEVSRWSFSPTFNDFGTTGLLQMPTARMAPDGTFAVGYSYTAPYTRYFITSQFLPWLQTTFRYTDIAYAPYGIVDTQSYKDKSFDVKIRLLEEDAQFPDVSLGLRDIGGTSIFSSEYLAASRRYYDFSFTLGVAWGSMGSRGNLTNPFSYLSDKFKTRPVSTGTGNFGTGFFRGEDIGVFGGVEWDTPLDGLRLKIEYDSNSYQKEYQGRRLAVASAINYGLSYEPFDGLDLALGYERGNTVMFRAVLSTDLNRDLGVPKLRDVAPLPAEQAVLEPPPPTPTAPATADLPGVILSTLAAHGVKADAVSIIDGKARVMVPAASSPTPEDLSQAALAVFQAAGGTLTTITFVNFDSTPLGQFEAGATPTPATARPDSEDAASEAGEETPAESPPAVDAPDDLRARLDKAFDYYGFTGEKVAIQGDRVIVIYSQGKFRNLAKAMGRVARAVALATGPEISSIEVVETARGLVIAHAVFPRAAVIRTARKEISVDELWMQVEQLPRDLPDGLGWGLEDVDPKFSFGLSPQLRQSIGGPNNFYLFQLYASLNASVDITPNFTIDGSLGVNLYNNYQNFTYDAPSGLPRVRTDIRRYLTTSDVWIDNLSASYFVDLGPDWYGRVSAGLFELMYGGVDAEVLYRPSGQRWALGLDINHVWQRDFDGGLGFRDYDVTTGHLTWYQMLPWYDLQTTLSVGRYLAGDVGATITLGREFANGVYVGAWATKTDVSPHQFGEGSFDKGFLIRIPFDLFTLNSTKSGGSVAFAPLTRDGGAKVITPYPLWGVTKDADQAYTGWRKSMR